MDNLNIHLAPYPRLYPHPVQVQSIGHVPHKRDWIRHTFTSFNFSFILGGSGTYRLGGSLWPVKAPCVITQWPGLYVEYGPQPEWEELYLIYNAAAQPHFQATGFATPGNPVWYVQDPVPLRRKLGELRELIGSGAGKPGTADRIDRVCEDLVLESHLGQAAAPAATSKAGAIDVLRQYLEENCAEAVDFNRLATEAGFSPASFRRHWARQVGVPPGQYMATVRMQQACRLLVETELSIKEIARRLRFDDALYFSRRFHQLTGSSATAYRRLHQNPTGGTRAT
jgi:AraC-like DNA-binding protein